MLYEDWAYEPNDRHRSNVMSREISDLQKASSSAARHVDQVSDDVQLSGLFTLIELRRIQL